MFGVLHTFTFGLIAVVAVRTMPKLLRSAVLKELKRTASGGEAPLQHQARALRTSIWGMTGFSTILAFIFFQKPVYGLTGLVFGIACFRLWAQLSRSRRQRVYDEEMLSVLTTLTGMVRSGLSLPASIECISKQSQYQIMPHLIRCMARFRSGQSFEEIMNQFRSRSGVRHSAAVLQIMGLAQNEGLAVSGMMQDMVDKLRNDLEMSQRIRSLRRSTVAQMAFAFLMPWGIVLLTRALNPDLLEGYFTSLRGVILIAFCLIFQSFGGVFLWKISRFR